MPCAGEARRTILEGYEPLLKKKRWCLLKRPVNLTDRQRLSSRELAKIEERLGRKRST